MNNVTNDLKMGLSYDELKKGLDLEFVYGQGTTMFKHFLTPEGQPMEQGQYEIVGNYKVLTEAKKVQQKIKTYMYARKLSKTHTIVIRNIMRNTKVTFVIAVLRLTDEDMEIKAKLGRKLSHNKNKIEVQ